MHHYELYRVLFIAKEYPGKKSHKVYIAYQCLCCNTHIYETRTFADVEEAELEFHAIETLLQKHGVEDIQYNEAANRLV